MSRRKTTGIVGGALAGGALLAGSFVGARIEQDVPAEERCTPTDASVQDRVLCSPQYVSFVLKHLAGSGDVAAVDAPTLPDTTRPDVTTTTTTTIAAAPVPRSVYVVGDSISQGAMGAGGLEGRLNAEGWENVNADTQCGRPVVGEGSYTSCNPDGSEQLTLNTVIRQSGAEAHIREADAIVTFAGTNDHWRSEQQVREGVTSYMSHIREINPTAQIYWVDTHLPGSMGDEMVNGVIDQSGAEVIKYSEIAENYYDTSCSDGIHPCNDGYQALAELVAQDIS